MHVAFISMRYPRNDSDFNRIFERRLVRHLKKSIDLSIFSWSITYKEPSYKIDNMQIEIIPNISPVRINSMYKARLGPGAFLLDLINDFLKILRTVTKLHRLNKKKKVDVILAASFSVSAFYSLFPGKLKKIPVVTQCFGYDVNVVPEIGYGLRVKNDKNKIMSDIVLKKVDMLLPNSEGLVNDSVLAKYRDRARVIYHGVDTNEFSSKSVLNSNTAPVKTKNNLLVLNVGGLRAVKGWKYIVETASRLKKYDIEFVIVGGDDEFEKFEMMVKKLGLKNIRYEGKPSHDKLKRYYHDADVFFLPSLSEGFPNAMLEAGSMECALLGSGKGGTREIILEGKNGYYIRDPDPDVFAEKILYLNNNRKLLKDMKKQSRIYIKNNFTWEKMAEEMAKFFNELVKNPGRNVK